MTSLKQVNLLVARLVRRKTRTLLECLFLQCHRLHIRVCCGTVGPGQFTYTPGRKGPLDNNAQRIGASQKTSSLSICRSSIGPSVAHQGAIDHQQIHDQSDNVAGVLGILAALLSFRSFLLKKRSCDMGYLGDGTRQSLRPSSTIPIVSFGSLMGFLRG